MVVGGGIGGIILLILVPDLRDQPGRRTGDGGTGAGTATRASSQTRQGTGGTALVSPSARPAPTPTRTPRAASSARSTRAGLLGQELPQLRHAVHPGQDRPLQRLDPVACGTASNQVGPFYCPLDKQGLHRRLLLRRSRPPSSAPTTARWPRSTSSPTSTATTSRTSSACSTGPSRTRRAPRAARVRIELMADCLAGVWANHATADQGRRRRWLPQAADPAGHQGRAVGGVVRRRRPDPAEGPGPGQPRDLDPRLVGAQRQQWFTTGYQSGDLNQCDTLNVPTV